MPYPIDQKFVVAIASSALFDLSKSDAIFQKRGPSAYERHQRKHENEPYPPGTAFPFVKRLLGLNDVLPENPVEVILLSRNCPDSGLRVFNSIEHHKLNISRAAFRRGRTIHEYASVFNSAIFLSANEEDVRQALSAGLAAGRILPSSLGHDTDDQEIRIAFDFDGVLGDDSSERVYQAEGLEGFHEHEKSLAEVPISPGPLKPLLEAISALQRHETAQGKRNPTYAPRLRTAIITARNAPAHKRIIHTMRAWKIRVDEGFFLGGIDKARVLEEWKPHIFFDDQEIHLDQTKRVVPSVHIPFGSANEHT